MRSLGRVLVANRGEIAVRVLRGCRDAGLPTAAVFSPADADACHVRAADRAVEIGPGPARESYLAADRILDAARRLGAGSVHPGYGFLAENAAFAEAVERAGLVWIGPPPAAIRAMGEKTAARRAMQAGGVPVVPGTLEPVAEPRAALAAAGETGFPVLLKAAAGGGGKGMRVVNGPAELEAAFAAASREAQAAFGPFIVKAAGPGATLAWVPVDDNLLHVGLAGTTPTSSWAWLGIASPHSGAPPDLLHTLGTSLVVLGLMLLLEHLIGRFIWPAPMPTFARARPFVPEPMNTRLNPRRAGTTRLTTSRIQYFASFHSSETF